MFGERSAQSSRHEASLLAPRWHTAALVALIASVAVLGTLLAGHGNAVVRPVDAHARVMAAYLPIMAVQWALLVYVCCVGRPSNALRSLLGEHFLDRKRLLGDAALAALTWVLIEGLEFAWGKWTGTGRSASVVALLPITHNERWSWAFVAASVGFCEEVVYRGYLLTQFAAFARRISVAVVLQAVLFGAAHADQGLETAARFVVYGILFGALARTRRSLLPCMLCHVGIDLVSGFLRG